MKRLSLQKISAAVFLVLGLLVGCGSHAPREFERPESTALADYQSTALGKVAAKAEAANPGLSGFGLLTGGNKAFLNRIGMIDQAQKTLDVQVYIWALDATGRIFGDRILRAADRGVRVRVLVDDFGLGPSDEGIAALDVHPNIEIRVFNPTARDKSIIGSYLFDFDRVNHRMHNKIMIADNALSIVGGRNMGDHYFDVDSHTNFRDLDIVCMGPVVRDVSTVFDYFWAGVWSVPASALVDRDFGADDLALLRKLLAQALIDSRYPYSLDEDLNAFYAGLGRKGNLLEWGRGAIAWDDPQDIVDEGKTGSIKDALANKLETIQHSLTIESAYFVPGDTGVKVLRELVERGIKVRVMTNSMVSNDVLAAHAGHASYRKALLEAGVEIYELRADTNVIEKNWSGDSQAGLHTKAFLFDDDSIFVGSYNLDPRSQNINTEAGIYVESAELAAQLKAYMDSGVEPKNSYHVTLTEKGKLQWTAEVDEKPVTYTKDPLSTWFQRFVSGFIQLLPVESQL